MIIVNPQPEWAGYLTAVTIIINIDYNLTVSPMWVFGLASAVYDGQWRRFLLFLSSPSPTPPF